MASSRPITDQQARAEGGWYRPNQNGGFCHCGCGRLAPLAPHSDRGKGWVKGQPVRFAPGHWLRSVRMGERAAV